MHQAWIRFGCAREAAAALTKAVPTESGASCSRLVSAFSTTTKTLFYIILCGTDSRILPCVHMCVRLRLQAATATNAVVRLLSQHEGKTHRGDGVGSSNPTRSARAKQRRLRKRAVAYLDELSQSVRCTDKSSQ